MATILHIETATTVCSVSLARNAQLLTSREIDNGYTHAENLHTFIADVLAEASTDISTLNAVAVSRGPGSYTGLRIGVSAAKGLAYGLKIPLISVDTLQILCQAARPAVTEGVLCPMIDARRMEVYTSLYDLSLRAISTTEALIVNEASIDGFRAYEAVTFFGDGMNKCRQILSTLPGAQFVTGIKPSAQHMCIPAYAKFMAKTFEDVAYFEPYYLKDFMILTKGT